MHDDEVMDQLLRDALAAETPQLSPAFDARVMGRLRPRRLTPIGRAVIAVYIAAAAAMAAWLMWDIPVEAIAAAVAIGVPVAAGASAYARRLAVAMATSSTRVESPPRHQAGSRS